MRSLPTQTVRRFDCTSPLITTCTVARVNQRAISTLCVIDVHLRSYQTTHTNRPPHYLASFLHCLGCPESERCVPQLHWFFLRAPIASRLLRISLLLLRRLRQHRLSVRSCRLYRALMPSHTWEKDWWMDWRTEGSGWRMNKLQPRWQWRRSFERRFDRFLFKSLIFQEIVCIFFSRQLTICIHLIPPSPHLHRLPLLIS